MVVHGMQRLTINTLCGMLVPLFTQDHSWSHHPHEVTCKECKASWIHIETSIEGAQYYPRVGRKLTK